MKRILILAAALSAGLAGVAQADTFSNNLVAAIDSNATRQAGHLVKVARVLLGYDQFGRPIYGHRRLPRVIVGYDQAGNPIYGHLYNNRPLFLNPNDYGSVVRPYRRNWDWGNRHWDRGEHRGWNGDHRRDGDMRRHDHDER